MTPDEVLIPAAISSWEQVVTRVGTLCLSCTEEELLVDVAPGKNRIFIFGDTSPRSTMGCSASCGWENGYTRNWTPSSSHNLTDPSRFQPQPRLPSVGRAFTLSSFRDSRPSALTSGWKGTAMYRLRSSNGTHREIDWLCA